MCKIHILRHTCGHYKNRVLSTCRGTFTTPHSGSKPLCLSEPSLVVTVHEPCQDCQFKKFCDKWESRIEAARPRRPTRRPIVMSFDDTDDNSFDDSWGEVGVSSMDWASHTDDAEMEQREMQRAEKEVAKLQSQYGKEKWDLFQSYLTPSEAMWRHPPMQVKKRTNTRTNGKSPLKKSIEPDDLGPMEPEEPGIRRVGSDVSDSSLEWSSDFSSSPDETEWSDFMLPAW